MTDTKLEILEANYWEHFKFAKELSLIYQPTNIKRIKLQEVINELITKIHELKKAKP